MQQPIEYTIDVRIILCTDCRLQIMLLYIYQGARRKLPIQIILNRNRKICYVISFIPLTKEVSYSRPCRSWGKEIVPAKIYRPSVVLEVTLLVRYICLYVDISGRYLPAAIFQKLTTAIYSHFEPSSHSDENHSSVPGNENFVVTKTLEIWVFWYVKFCQWACGYRHASRKLLPTSSRVRQEVFLVSERRVPLPKRLSATSQKAVSRDYSVVQTSKLATEVLLIENFEVTFVAVFHQLTGITAYLYDRHH